MRVYGSGLEWMKDEVDDDVAKSIEALKGDVERVEYVGGWSAYLREARGCASLELQISKELSISQLVEWQFWD